MLYYSYPQIVMQEVPDEISLALSMSGCNLKCKGCHSADTWNPRFGKPLTKEELIQLIQENKHISCVLFYGGEWQPEYLLELIKIVKQKKLKVCLYTGLEYHQVPRELIEVLDYIKVGPYIEELGGLESPKNNQRFIKLSQSE